MDQVDLESMYRVGYVCHVMDPGSRLSREAKLALLHYSHYSDEPRDFRPQLDVLLSQKL